MEISIFQKFSQEKTRYEKGQIFPFMIALIVVVVIMALVTVNIGQVDSFKTDTSNAADAAALAGASVLSGALLGFGLKSDMMAGYGTTLILGIQFALGLNNIIGAISMYISALISQLADYFTALGEGKMAWTNAKQSALTYAFNNANVDEPKPTFKQFLSDAYGINNPNSLTPAEVRDYYNGYFKGEGSDEDDTRTILKYSRSGFAKFLEDNKKGFWSVDEFGDVSPKEMAPAIMRSGYGWSDDDNGIITNSYCDANGQPYNDAKKYGDLSGGTCNYENCVEVEVIGSVMYPLEMLLVSDVEALEIEVLAYGIPLWFISYENAGDYWWGALIAFAVVGIYEALMAFFIVGLKMGGDGIEAETTDNPLQVKTTRYKQEHNTGLWNFQYGDIESQAISHAFMENGDETIEPVLYQGFLDFGFDTTQHLFETELTHAF